MLSLKLKLQTVAEKTAKNFRGLLYFAAPGRPMYGERYVIGARARQTADSA